MNKTEPSVGMNVSKCSPETPFVAACYNWGMYQRYRVRSRLREARRVPSGDQAMAESVNRKEGEYPCQQEK